ncbi:hypothetical protein A2837_02925 [Candidatus Kaiserbacteria bacterium RIFCSPHIGHO2_01_FULL_46_22]|uniref:Uncharacterized protein n=1 Tax=Candidatus Kaiserbacteria bacterium RIFCSPHIGHO2_01_FULL_46_22 TaxID=1798475 RepID=A0A1F6BX76_9BACT|nr:MAG: hypothetical protein A2837_02925 [Candidatus Kaiserbacteria bacterium RIFCSPHIGHO2_01_FULL_46_22]
MTEVILTIGPQYAGKSTFCKKVVELNPDIYFVSRDDILMELFGTVWLGSYSGGHHIAYEIMWKKAKRLIKKKPRLLILDCWNGPTRERLWITDRLKKLGISNVIGWYFVTPFNQCVEWSLGRDPPKHEREKEWRKIEFNHIYNDFHRQSVETEKGFQNIVRINPLIDTPEQMVERLKVLV